MMICSKAWVGMARGWEWGQEIMGGEGEGRSGEGAHTTDLPGSGSESPVWS